MNKTFLLTTILLSGSLFAQEKTFQSGKGHNCISISRGCLNNDGNNSITFNIESVQKDRIMFSISTTLARASCSCNKVTQNTYL